MIQAIIEINPDRTRQLVNTIIDPKDRSNVGLKMNQIIERYKTEQEASEQLDLWNGGVKLEAKLKVKENGVIKEIDPYEIDINKISDEGKELIRKAIAIDSNKDRSEEDSDNAWLAVIRLHNQEGWSNEKYCCAGNKLKLRIYLNKIRHHVGF